MNDYEILKLVAKKFAGSNWHNLSSPDREIVAHLESAGYLLKNKPCNGFVGKAADYP